MRSKIRSLKKKETTPDRIVYMHWPVLNPGDLFEALIRADALHLLQGKQWSWLEFWKQASCEDWGAGHPVLKLPAASRERAIGIAFHGDEGQGKRTRNVLVLSWSSVAVHGRSEVTKFPFAVDWLQNGF